jgi:hypothetical protein
MQKTNVSSWRLTLYSNALKHENPSQLQKLHKNAGCYSKATRNQSLYDQEPESSIIISTRVTSAIKKKYIDKPVSPKELNSEEKAEKAA